MMSYTSRMTEQPSERWCTVEEIAHEVHAPMRLVEQWVEEGKIATRLDLRTQMLLVSADDVEDIAEEEALRLLSRRALAHDDRD